MYPPSVLISMPGPRAFALLIVTRGSWRSTDGGPRGVAAVYGVAEALARLASLRSVRLILTADPGRSPGSETLPVAVAMLASGCARLRRSVEPGRRTPT